MSLKTALINYLGLAAKAVIQREHPFIIAITGSIGKTTTRQMIGAVLQSDLFPTEILLPKKNFNNELGLPLTIFRSNYPERSPIKWLKLLSVATAARFGLWKNGAKIYVLEMGADAPGDLAYLTSIAKPDVSVITAVTPDDPSMPPVHTANYPSIDALAEEKSTLVKALRAGGTAVLNGDDRRVFAMRHLIHEHVITFGETDASDVRILECGVVVEEGERMNTPKGLRVVLAQYGHRYDFFFDGVYGTPIAYAAAAAVGTASACDVAQDQVSAMSKHFFPMPGRTRLIPGIKHTTILDDSYNASPASVRAALLDLQKLNLKPEQRRAACLGEMRELGQYAEIAHREIGAVAARSGLDLLVVCGIFAHAMAEGALANGMTPEQVHVAADTPEAGLYLQDWIKPGDVVLVKASEGPGPSSPNFHKVTGVRMDRVVKELMAEPMRAEELLARQNKAWLST